MINTNTKHNFNKKHCTQKVINILMCHVLLLYSFYHVIILCVASIIIVE